jgi:beta-phosphoglucomutase-like phosphatase (HAD superfamily)
LSTDLVIFDCDGVIADSEILSAEALIAELSRSDFDIDLEDVLRDFLGRSFPSVVQIIRDRFGRALPEDFERAYQARLLERFEADLQATPGFRDMLADLDLPICVATSSSPPRVARTLALLGLTDSFGRHVFTASQVARGKSAPDLFLFAAGTVRQASRRQKLPVCRCCIILVAAIRADVRSAIQRFPGSMTGRNFRSFWFRRLASPDPRRCSVPFPAGKAAPHPRHGGSGRRPDACRHTSG